MEFISPCEQTSLWINMAENLNCSTLFQRNFPISISIVSLVILDDRQMDIQPWSLHKTILLPRKEVVKSRTCDNENAYEFLLVKPLNKRSVRKKRTQDDNIKTDIWGLGFWGCWSQWQPLLMHEISSVPRALGSWFRISLNAWMSVCVYSMFVLFCV
jgi:hypothetical protein